MPKLRHLSSLYCCTCMLSYVLTQTLSVHLYTVHLLVWSDLFTLDDMQFRYYVTFVSLRTCMIKPLPSLL